MKRHPRPNGNTAAMVEAFAEGARESGHEVTFIPVCRKKLAAALPVNIATPRERADASSRTICRRFTLLIISSGSDHVYCGAINEYQNSFLNNLKLEDMGIYSAYGEQNKSQAKLDERKASGKGLQ